MNRTRLMVLGLLKEAPRHGYEIQRWLEESRTETWANVLPGSIYHALQQLQKEGCVQVHEIAHTGHRIKAVYAITEVGLLEFHRLLREAFEHPPHTFPASFYTALTFLEELPPTEALALIEALIPKLEQEMELWRDGERIKNAHFPLPAYIRTLFINGREHLEADLRMLHRLRELLALDKS